MNIKIHLRLSKKESHGIYETFRYTYKILAYLVLISVIDIICDIKSFIRYCNMTFH
jgi:hypothetical protein